MKYLSTNKPTVLDSLESILELSEKTEEITVNQILTFLAGKGYPVLLIIFSLPFCFPIQIPGFSTPFGILLGFIGLRIAFARRPWWPRWILERSFSSQAIHKIVTKAIGAIRAMQKILHPRLLIFTQNKLLRHLNGFMVFIPAIFLALPLPLPMTNLIAAAPILCIGLGLLEDDGVFILIGYFLSLFCLLFFLSLFFFGMFQINHFFSS